jgi:hypothetical protein
MPTMVAIGPKKRRHICRDPPLDTPISRKLIVRLRQGVRCFS